MEGTLKKIIVVIPAFNEEGKIYDVVQNVRKFVDEVIVVNDHSADRTAEKAGKAGARVITHVLNRGQGAALETGTQIALRHGADIIVHFDADGQFLAEEIDELVKPLMRDEADICMGSRFMEIPSNMPAMKKYCIMPLARLIIRILYGAVLTDPQNGFRAFNRKFGERLEIENDGAAHCTEIIVHTLKGPWRFKEIPVTVNYDTFGQGIFSGKGRGSGGVKILKSLFYQKLSK